MVPHDDLDTLLAMAESDETLMEALRSAASPEEVVALGQARGLRIRGGELLADHELSDAELVQASGGTMMRTAIYYACLETLPRFC